MGLKSQKSKNQCSSHGDEGCKLTFKRKRFVLPDFFSGNLECVWYPLILPRIRILDHMDGLVFVQLPWGLGRWFQDSCGSTSPGFELNSKTPTRNHWSFRGGLKHFLFSPQNLGTWSNLTSIFFKWVGLTTNSWFSGASTPLENLRPRHEERRGCNGQPCPINCVWHPFGAWQKHLGFCKTPEIRQRESWKS